jgi:hypothetical protein
LGGGDLTALQGQQALVADEPNAIGAGVAGAPATAGVPSAAPGVAPGVVDSGAWDVPSAASAVGGGSQSTLSQLGNFFKPATDFLNGPTGKLLGAGVAGAGLLKNLASAVAPNPIRGQAELEALARSLGSTGAGLIGPNAAGAAGVAQQATDQAATLQNYLTTGTLPPAVQASLDRATEDAVTKIKSDFAARGVGPESTQEQAAIASVRQNATIQGGTLAAQLYSQGVTLDQLAAQVYRELTVAGASVANAGASALGSGVATNLGINNGLNTAIANLGAALGGRNVSNTGTQAAA